VLDPGAVETVGHPTKAAKQWHSAAASVRDNFGGPGWSSFGSGGGEEEGRHGRPLTHPAADKSAIAAGEARGEGPGFED
tara:strand:- start:3807 stop:4043 length:237 start_codon:yes stop_codon:yes gene_type:complete